MLTNDDKCFVCGMQNLQGLRLEFSYSQDGSKAETTFVPDARYQGWSGIVHGGIITTLLDEAMAKVAVHNGYNILTGEITAKFKNSAKIGEPLRFEAEIEQVKKKIVYARAAAYTESGTVVAEATSKMFVSSTGTNSLDDDKEKH